MVAGMVRNGSRMLWGMTAALPVTINTAMVSPMARPMPNTMPEVIPEIEMPAHTNSSLAAYPEYACPTVNHYTAVLPGMGGINYNTEYCVGNEKTYEFLNNILDEVIQLFPSQYIHLGGDEANKKAWETCPKCQKLMKKEGISNIEHIV